MKETNRPQAEVKPLPTGRDEVLIESVLPGVNAEDAWFHASTERGINDELRPLLRMHMPKDATWARLTDVPVGVPAGRCRICLGGLVPVDYDDLLLEEVGPGMRFRERSSMRTIRMWEHERTITQLPEGTLVRDRIVFEVLPRLVRTRPVHRALVGAVFRHRHRRLRRVIGPRLAELAGTPTGRPA